MPFKLSLEKPAGLNLKLRILALICLIILPATFVLALLYIKGFGQQLALQVNQIGENNAKSLDNWFGGENGFLARQAHEATKPEEARKAELKNEIERLVKSPSNIIAIDVFLRKESGLTLEASTQQKVWEYPPQNAKDAVDENKIKLERSYQEGVGNILDIFTPLHINDKIGGAIHLVVSVPESEKWLADTQKQLLVGTLAIIMLMAIVLYFYLNLSISNPIKRLVEGMSEATKGNLQATVNIETADEVGWLALHFNRMLRQISQFHQELEKKVHQATKEVELRNEELRRANDMLFTIQRKLSQTERLASLGQLSATLAHELGTTLNVIAGHLQIMASTDGLAQEAKERLALVESQVGRLTGIIRNVLKSMQLPEPTLARRNVNDIINEVTTFISPTLAANNIKVELALQKGLPFVKLDRYQLEQVFMNLLSNAIDAMTGGGTLRIETKRIDANEVSIKFSDTGKGITEDELKHIFEPFFSTKEMGKGVGIGLTICREIIKKHKGVITAESMAGKGAAFTIKLPAELAETENARA